MRQVWFVRGEHDEEYVMPTLFDTKEAAEVYARGLFPDEDEVKRYGRVYYREVMTINDLRK